MKVTTSNLDEAVMAELDAFALALPEEIAKAQKAAAKTAIKNIKAKAPGSGRYAKGWKSKTTQTRLGAETVIYQGDRPGLPHLLEFGHPVISGGRTVGQAQANPHIAPAESAAIEKFESELVKGIENGT